MWRPKRRPAKYAAMSATQTMTATASSAHGLASRRTTSAVHVGQTTSHPASPAAHGSGRQRSASQAGTANTQK